MRCLCCGKAISANADETEKRTEWHKRCVKKFFGTAVMPKVDISEEIIEKIAMKTVEKGYTVPGVQKKLSLNLQYEPELRLTVVDYPTGYILKPQTGEYEQLPQMEHLTMKMAEAAGINTVPHALIKNNGEYAYITRRVDRVSKDDGTQGMLAMEDFCQLSERLTADKYKGSYEKCTKIVNRFSTRSGLDLTELYMRIVFSFIVGNSDMHLKNFSLVETSPGRREYCLSPAYDLLPVNIVLPEDNEQTALTLGGRKSNLKRRDFMKFAEVCGIPDSAASKMVKKLCSMQLQLIKLCNESLLSDNYKEAMISLMKERIAVLKG